MVMSVNEKMTAIADAIRDKTGGTDELSLDDMATEIPKVYDAGAKSEYDRFWDGCQNNGRPFWNAGYLFGSRSWNDITFTPKYDIAVTHTANHMFFRCLMTNLRKTFEDRGLKIDLSRVTNVNSFFETCEALLETCEIETAHCTSFNYIFQNCIVLHTIPKINFSSAITATRAFRNTPKLKNVNIEGTIPLSMSFSTSPLLTLESLKSIITALVDYTGTDYEFDYTLTLNSNSIALLEEEGATAEYTDSEGSVTTGLTWQNLIEVKKWNLA